MTPSFEMKVGSVRGNPRGMILPPGIIFINSGNCLYIGRKLKNYQENLDSCIRITLF
ncbi:conserved hypothetical protein [delta proteobacterium NaphS2]|nr:conserved hypothetical protein [delta proteobacterium NaphS2]